MKTLKFIYPIFILSLISIMIFISCQQEESFDESNKNNKDICSSLPPNVDFDKLTKGDLEIISQAFHRLDLRENEDGLFEIIQHKGKDINISEELFNYFQLIAENTNNKFLSEIHFNRNRIQTREESGNYKTDCVSQSIVYATGQSSMVIDSWITNKYGNKGVPSNDFYQVMDQFCKGAQVPIETFKGMNIIDLSNTQNKYVIVIKNTHAVNLTAKSGNEIIYWDAQNGKSGFCTTSDVTHAYAIKKQP